MNKRYPYIVAEIGGNHNGDIELGKRMVRSAKECGADAVKLEGGRTMLPLIRRLVEVGIPVMGHIGLLPQSVLKDGGYRIHGRAEEERKALLEDAAALDEAKTVKGKPTMILARTVKGKGVSFMENNAGWHGKAPNAEQYAVAHAELAAAVEALEKEGE